MKAGRFASAQIIARVDPIDIAVRLIEPSDRASPARGRRLTAALLPVSGRTTQFHTPQT
jgi:hypothetical protein